MSRFLLAVAAVLAAAGAFMARSQSLTWLIPALAGPLLVVALLPRAVLGRQAGLLLTAVVAAGLAGYAVWDSLVDLANGILFWWPAALAVAALAAARRTSRT